WELDLPLDHMQVGVADATGRDLHQYLPGSGLWLGNLLKTEVPSNFCEDGGFHCRYASSGRPTSRTSASIRALISSLIVPPYSILRCMSRPRDAAFGELRRVIASIRE